TVVLGRHSHQARNHRASSCQHIVVRSGSHEHYRGPWGSGTEPPQGVEEWTGGPVMHPHNPQRRASVCAHAHMMSPIALGVAASGVTMLHVLENYLPAAPDKAVTIGVALGGGSARGYAHFGALASLE